MLAGEWDFYARLSDFIIRGNRKSDDSFNIEIYSYDDENTQTRELSGGRQLSLTEEELRLTIGLLRTML